VPRVRRARWDALKDRRRLRLVTITGLSSIVICVVLALVAYAYYPRAFSPATNWLSDLGNTLLNPQGSIFFRVDMAVVGIVLTAFFVGLTDWHRGQHPVGKALLGLGQFSGLVAAAALVMTGIESENDRAAHALWATVLFIAVGGAVWLIGWAPVWHPRLPRRLPYVAIVVCSADLIALLVRRYWVEWLAVGLLLAFVAAVAVGTWTMAATNTDERSTRSA
jgi:hypothetical membrane protein